MSKRTITEKDEVIFKNPNNTDGNMNYFWFSAFVIKNTKTPYISLGINGNDRLVFGRYDQKISIDEAKDIVDFLTNKIKDFEKVDV